MHDLTIAQIAQVVRKNWANISPAAKPYLQAMESMEKITDNYGSDSGTGIVSYFLSNAQGWRGEVAKDVKRELNRRLKEYFR